MNQHDVLIDSMIEVAKAVALTSAPAGLSVMTMLSTAADALTGTASPEKIQALRDRRAEIDNTTTAQSRRAAPAFVVEP